MTEAAQILNDRLLTSLRGDGFWKSRICSILDCPDVAIHLGILVEPFLRLVLDGTKTMESRFSKRRVVPYKSVMPGDVLLLKRAAGPIVGICQIDEVLSYDLTPGTLDAIRNEHARALAVEEENFWASRIASRFATLMALSQVRGISPIKFNKRDKRGWVVLRGRATQGSLSAMWAQG